jgi:hypothetical protein
MARELMTVAGADALLTNVRHGSSIQRRLFGTGGPQRIVNDISCPSSWFSKLTGFEAAARRSTGVDPLR